MRKTHATVISALWFAFAPGLISGLIPWLLTDWQVRHPVSYWAPVRAVGAVLIMVSVAALVQAFAQFVREGLGSPAPVAPPERLVVGGLYRYVRNPMYVASVAAIVGQALVLGQLGLLWYAAAVALAVAGLAYVYEEPVLRRQFGAQYDEYRRHVGGWVPRLRPWTPDA